MKILCMIIFLSLLGGCASKLYYFGDYSESLYAYKKTPNEKTMKKHTDELKDIIQESKDKNIRVPPGIYCEYAYMLLQQGKKDDALQQIQLEEQTYPESRTFTTRLRNMIVSGSKGPTESTINSIPKEHQ
jgi:hypothetical protein